LSSEDYYKGETDREIRVTVAIELNKGEMKDFASHFGKVRKYMKELENTFELEYSSKSSVNPIVRFNGFEVLGTNLFLSPVVGTDYRGIDWEKIARRFKPEIKLPLVEFIKRELKGKNSIHFPFDVSKPVLEMFTKKTKTFVEIRQCPSGTNQNVLESYDGTLVADVLCNLKNGNSIQRGKWEQIKREFHNLFPSLELELTKPAGKTPRIMIVKDAIEYEVPVSNVGAGIWEIVILLTHLFSFESMCFGIDMPELHFHHHTIRLLRNILRGKSEGNQFLIVTHSPLFIEPDRLENVLVVREEKGKTVIKQLDKALDSNERERLRRHLGEHAREFFFSRAVLIVEGSTEKGAMPIFSRLLKKDFDKYGISVIEAGGQFSGIFIRILKAFDFPYLVMHDYDALMHISQSIEREGKSIETSAVFYNLKEQMRKNDSEILEKMEARIESIGDKRRKKIYPHDCFRELKDIALRYDVYVLPTNFEGVLKRDGYEKFLKEARKFSGRKRSKVICGRYVAEKIGENKLKIPTEFRDVVSRIVKKSSSRVIRE